MSSPKPSPIKPVEAPKKRSPRTKPVQSAYTAEPKPLPNPVITVEDRDRIILHLSK